MAYNIFFPSGSNFPIKSAWTTLKDWNSILQKAEIIFPNGSCCVSIWKTVSDFPIACCYFVSFAHSLLRQALAKNKNHLKLII